MVSAIIKSSTRATYYPGAGPIWVKLVADPSTGRVLGGQIVGVEGAAKRIDVLAACVWTGMAVDELALMDLSYAPPYSPVLRPVAGGGAGGGEGGGGARAEGLGPARRVGRRLDRAGGPQARSPVAAPALAARWGLRDAPRRGAAARSYAATFSRLLTRSARSS